MTKLLGVAKFLAYPWPSLSFAAAPGEPRPYFGPRSFGLGGPALKREKLIARFGSFWWRPNLLYITSGLPFPISYIRLAKSRGARVLLNQDGVYTPSWYGPGYEAANNVLSSLHALADHVIYQSLFCRESSRRYLRLPAHESSEILYNGVDLQTFIPRQKPRTETFKLLCAGYFYESKLYALTSLLKSFALLLKKHPAAQLSIAGRIENTSRRLKDQSWLAREVRELELPSRAVTFLGRYSRQQAPLLFQQHDALVHLKNNDPCPSIVLEALACGLPVVHCSSGGTPELVGDAGVRIDHEAPLEETDQPPAIEKILEALLQMIQNHSAIVLHARPQAERFSLEAWYNRHQSIMQRLLTP